MSEATVQLLTAAGVVIALAWNIAQFYLSRRGRDARSRADDADAYESLVNTVTKLSTEIKDLRRELDVERRARELADKRVAELETEIAMIKIQYKRDVTRLEFENSALRDALGIDDLEND